MARDKLNEADFAAIALTLGGSIRARKVGRVAARRAASRTAVETRWNGKESQDVAEPGDWIVTNLSASRQILRDASGGANTYVIRAAKFPLLYETDQGENEFGEIYNSKGVVDAVFLPGGFEIIAPWGEIQRSPQGYLVCNGDEVYGNNRETFEATYDVVR